VEPAASSIPRYDLDAALLKVAKAAGVDVREEVLVSEVSKGSRIAIYGYDVCRKYHGEGGGQLQRPMVTAYAARSFE